MSKKKEKPKSKERQTTEMIFQLAEQILEIFRSPEYRLEEEQALAALECAKTLLPLQDLDMLRLHGFK